MDFDYAVSVIADSCAFAEARALLDEHHLTDDIGREPVMRPRWIVEIDRPSADIARRVGAEAGGEATTDC